MPASKPYFARNKLAYLVWFNQVDKSDIPLVGGKGANLGEMVKAGFPVPNGFIITSAAYYYLLQHNQLANQIGQILDGLNVHRSQDLDRASQVIRRLIVRASIPQDLADKVLSAYDKLSGAKDALVAVRSSATAEDLPDASLAGQQETYLNVKGDANLIQTIRHAWSSLFTPRAIFYREEKKFD